MRFIIRADGRGRCIWLQANGGVVFDAGAFEEELTHIDQARLAELLAAADDVDQIESFGTAEVLAGRISALLIPILQPPTPNLGEAPIFEVPTTLAERLDSPVRLTVAEWIQRFPG
jgi:hypothetical protein